MSVVMIVRSYFVACALHKCLPVGNRRSKVVLSPDYFIPLQKKGDGGRKWKKIPVNVPDLKPLLKTTEE